MESICCEEGNVLLGRLVIRFFVLMLANKDVV